LSGRARKPVDLVRAPGERLLGHHGGVVDAPDDDVRPEAGPFPEVLDQEMAARFLGMRPRTLAEMTRRGEVPARKVGRDWRYSRPALHRWLAGELDAPGDAPPGA